MHYNLEGRLTQGGAVALDDTLTLKSAAAQARATGDAINEVKASVNAHEEDTANPHGVTKAQLGLGNVDDTADMDKPVSTATAAAIKNVTDDLNSRKAETETYHGTFSVSGWSGAAPFTQSITIPGILLTDYPFVDIDLSEVTDASAVIEAWKLVGRCVVSANDTVLAYCYEEKPEVNIPILFKVVR